VLTWSVTKEETMKRVIYAALGLLPALASALAIVGSNSVSVTDTAVVGPLPEAMAGQAASAPPTW
jgi:hypothetical protein